MRLRSSLAALGVAAAMGVAGSAPAAAGGYCWGPNPGLCDRTVRHYVYAPGFENVYYVAPYGPNPYYGATFGPNRYPSIYVPRGYWRRYQRPYARYQRPYWRPFWRRGRTAVVVPVPAPMPVPVDCGWRCRDGYLK